MHLLSIWPFIDSFELIYFQRALGNITVLTHTRYMKHVFSMLLELAIIMQSSTLIWTATRKMRLSLPQPALPNLPLPLCQLFNLKRMCILDSHHRLNSWWVLGFPILCYLGRKSSVLLILYDRQGKHSLPMKSMKDVMLMSRPSRRSRLFWLKITI